MMSRVFGAVLLIIGTCVGGSILALPLVTTGLSFTEIALILLGVWIVMTLGALWIMELNLCIPGHSNLISMARGTLGKPGTIITWVAYLLLLYSLLSLYLEGGTDLVQGLTQQISGYHLQNWQATLLFLAVFLLIIYNGIRYIDWSNRGLMTIKLTAFFLLLIILIPYDSINLLTSQPHNTSPSSSVMPIVNSFGFAIIIPSLSLYLNKQRKAITWTTLIGSIFPLLAYLAWIFSVHSSMDPTKLSAVAQSPSAISDLANLINTTINTGQVTFLTNLFMSICITTSFLGVSLSMLDFLMDGLKLRAESNRVNIAAIAIAFIPPAMIVILQPGLFIQVLKYAGALCVVLLILLPALMNVSAAYIRPIMARRPFYCHWVFLSIGLLSAMFLMYLACLEIF